MSKNYTNYYKVFRRGNKATSLLEHPTERALPDKLQILEAVHFGVLPEASLSQIHKFTTFIGNSNRVRGFLLQHLLGEVHLHEVDGRRQFVNKGCPENEARMRLGSIQFSRKSLLGYMKLFFI